MTLDELTPGDSVWVRCKESRFGPVEALMKYEGACDAGTLATACKEAGMEVHGKWYRMLESGGFVVVAVFSRRGKRGIFQPAQIGPRLDTAGLVLSGLPCNRIDENHARRT